MSELTLEKAQIIVSAGLKFPVVRTGRLGSRSPQRSCCDIEKTRET